MIRQGGTRSKVEFNISGENGDSGIRLLTDGVRKVVYELTRLNVGGGERTIYTPTTRDQRTALLSRVSGQEHLNLPQSLFNHFHGHPLEWKVL